MVLELDDCLSADVQRDITLGCDCTQTIEGAMHVQHLLESCRRRGDKGRILARSACYDSIQFIRRHFDYLFAHGCGDASCQTELHMKT